MGHIIDVDAWERRDNYSFFTDFLNSWYSVTTEIDCTEASAAARADGRSFFLCYAYAILRAANEVKELRYRKNNDGQVVLHDTIDLISPIAVPGKTFFTVRIPFHQDFETFYSAGLEIMTGIPADGDPYGESRALEQRGEFDVILLSAVPKMYFTSTTNTVAEAGRACKYPLTATGKMVPREGRFVFPLSVYVDHAFVDGAHLAAFFEKIEFYLKEISVKRSE